MAAGDTQYLRNRAAKYTRLFLPVTGCNYMVMEGNVAIKCTLNKVKISFFCWVLCILSVISTYNAVGYILFFDNPAFVHTHTFTTLENNN